MLRIVVLGCLMFLCCAMDAQTVVPIRDSLGRILILHGVNMGGGAKHVPGHQPWITERDVEREHHELGWNSVRYLIFWGAIEPQKDSFDEVYLRNVKERVEWYTKRGMYVVLDMHQDVYGYGVGGNGAPEWASTHTHIQNLIPDKWPWWMQNLEPKVIQSYVTFFKYKKRKELQDHYILSWLKVIHMFQGNSHVIGYDLMNEPHGGKIIKTLTGGFEKKWLAGLYQRLIPAIRRVDTTRYIFVEPRSFGVNFGMKSHLRKVSDTIVNKLVYAPHVYMKFVDVGGDYKPKDTRSLSKWFKHRDSEVAMQRSGMMLGEFGLSSSKKDFDKYLQDILRGIDKRQASWAYWSGDPGGWGPWKPDMTPSPIMWQLLRVYPSAVAGQLLYYRFDADKKYFEMEYINDATIDAPTVISVPAMLMKENYQWDVEGVSHYTAERDPRTNALSVVARDNHLKIKVRVFPAGVGP